LDKKYKVENINIKKSIVNKSLDFKMIDSKIILDEVQEF
jgi:hypothetical protein